MENRIDTIYFDFKINAVNIDLDFRINFCQLKTFSRKLSGTSLNISFVNIK